VTQFSRHFWPSFWSTVLSANRPIWLGTWLARPSLVPPRHVLHRSGCGWGTPFRPQGSRRGDRGDSADARYMIVLVTMLHVTRPTALAARDRRQPLVDETGCVERLVAASGCFFFGCCWTRPPERGIARCSESRPATVRLLHLPPRAPLFPGARSQEQSRLADSTGGVRSKRHCRPASRGPRALDHGSAVASRN